MEFLIGLGGVGIGGLLGIAGTFLAMRRYTALPKCPHDRIEVHSTERMESTNRSEHDLTAAVNAVVRRLYESLRGDGPEFDDLDAIQKLNLRDSVLPIVVATLNYEDEKPFQPKREDEVAEWIKRRRDGDSTPKGWHDTLDHLLDDYRLHADTGVPLSEDVA